jgi:hypothetical protein
MTGDDDDDNNNNNNSDDDDFQQVMESSVAYDNNLTKYDISSKKAVLNVSLLLLVYRQYLI